MRACMYACMYVWPGLFDERTPTLAQHADNRDIVAWLATVDEVVLQD